MSGAQLIQVQTVPAEPVQCGYKLLGFLGAGVGCDDKKYELGGRVESSAPGQRFGGSTQREAWALQGGRAHGRKARAKVESRTSKEIAIERLKTVKKQFRQQSVCLLQELAELSHDAGH